MQTITVTEIGRRVLTLNEVIQTFDVDSAMFNIKLNEASGDCRTVVMKKRWVEVQGKKKLIIMIRDLTDKVKLEEANIKRVKEKMRAMTIKKNLDEVFTQH